MRMRLRTSDALHVVSAGVRTRCHRSASKYVLGTVARPSALVVVWRRAYAVAIGVGLPLLLIAFIGIRGMLATLAAMAVLIGVATIWDPSRRYLADSAWRVRLRRRAEARSEDSASTLPLLVAAYWASGI